MRRKRWLPAAAVCVAVFVLALAAACGDGGSDPDTSPTPTPDFTAEQGNDPVFYRTTDGFASIAIGQPYKVLLRITNGYAEETLRVVAERPTDGMMVEFEPLRAEPTGDDNPPGAYYPLALNLPEQGTWQLYVMAGDVEAIIFVDVPPPTG